MALGTQVFQMTFRGVKYGLRNRQNEATTGSSGQWRSDKNGTFRVGNCLELSSFCTFPGSGEHARKPAPLGETGKMRGGTKHSVSCRLQGGVWDSPSGAAPSVLAAPRLPAHRSVGGSGRGSPPGFHAHDTGTEAAPSPHAMKSNPILHPQQKSPP